jgi:hypothetical protein
LAALLLVSCSSSEDLTIVRSGIAHFRELMAAEQFGQIYAEAANDLKNSATEKQLVDFLAAVNRKLGSAKDSKDSGWAINFRISGAVVTLTLKTEFEKGSGIETFVYRVAGKDAQLMGYHLNSNDLITN